VDPRHKNRHLELYDGSRPRETRIASTRLPVRVVARGRRRRRDTPTGLRRVVTDDANGRLGPAGSDHAR